MQFQPKLASAAAAAAAAAAYAAAAAAAAAVSLDAATVASVQSWREECFVLYWQVGVSNAEESETAWRVY